MNKVTVCYVDILDQWEKSVEFLDTQITLALTFAHSRSLNVKIQLPLKHTNRDNLLTEFQREIYAKEWGSFQICNRGTIRWEPVPHNSVADLAIFIQRDIAPLTEEENELLIRSFRNTFDRKRKQFPPHVPAILVLRLGHYRLATNDVIEMLRQRIWPAEYLSWRGAKTVSFQDASDSFEVAFGNSGVCISNSGTVAIRDYSDFALAGDFSSFSAADVSNFFDNNFLSVFEEHKRENVFASPLCFDVSGNS